MVKAGTWVSEHELRSLGFVPLGIEFTGKRHDLKSGTCSDWNTIGVVPEARGVYAFVVEEPDAQLRVVYVGRTEHLWMVTKGTLPQGLSRPGQRYGRPKWAGVTRERINAHVTAAVADGLVVTHWVCARQPDEDLDLIERNLIKRWDLVRCGWNRR